jgi:putative transposase
MGRGDEALRQRLRELAAEHPRWGSPMLHDVLRAEGLVMNHKRTERIYREEGLLLRRRRRRKLPKALRVPLAPAERPNQRWSIDFIHDQAQGRRFRALTIVDDFTRQCPAIEVDTSIGGERVVAVLEKLIAERGVPEAITLDNGPEFTGKALHQWAATRKVRLHFIDPGKPHQNAFVESFNGKFREECLSQHWFSALEEARLLIEHWRIKYNQIRPHRGIGRIPPDRFAKQFEQQKQNTNLNPKAA